MDVKHCFVCGEPSTHNEKYDAYYCKPCDIWLEFKCMDLGCGFCPDRPEKPSEIEN
jgi:hypothetical protein